MKRIVCILILIVIFIPVTACSSEKIETNEVVQAEYIDMPCTKDSVEEFMSIHGEVELGGLSTGFTLDEEHCYNVTPPAVANETDIKIFKYSDSCVSLAWIDGKVFQICQSFGGYGFVDAVPWDYDNDGNLDLLVASSWGSGLHRSEISVFNTKTKQSTVFHVEPELDLIVTAVSPMLSSKNAQDLPVYYGVYSADIEAANHNLADLSYNELELMGFVCVENGVPILKPTKQ